MLSKKLPLIVVAVLVACTNGSPPADVSVPPANSTRKTNFLAYDEMVAAHADGGDLYVAISRLRPNWLIAHGVAGQGPPGSELAKVYLDGQPYGDPNSLRNISAYHVGDVTYYDVTQAGARFGINGGSGGVIDVRTKGAATR